MAKKEPEDQRLPGMEDPVVEELERLAKSYAKLRDKRQAILLQEVGLKGELLGAMKKNGKDHYKHGKVEISIVSEEETIKVKIAKEKDDESD